MPIGTRARAVADDEERHFGTGQTLLDHEPRAGVAEPALAHRGDDGRFGLGAIVGDDDALAGGQAVGLQDDRESELAAIGRTRAPRRAMSQVRKRAVGTPCRAMNAFANALLDSRRAAAAVGPKSSRSGRGESIGDAEAQRQLRTDDGEVDLLALGERERARRDREMSTGNGPGERGDAGIARGADELADVAIGGEPGDERVLARAAADDENSHVMNDLRGDGRLHAVRAAAGTISLTLAGFAPRIRAYL